MTKICSKCNQNKSRDLFSKDKSRKDGLNRICKLCWNKSIHSWRSNNPEKVKFYNRTQYLSNPEKKKSYHTVWAKKNLDKCNSKTAKYRALKLKATPLWAESEKDDIQELYAEAKRMTTITGIKHHVDHIVPLKSDIVQGFHCLANLQVIDAKHNQSKSNQTWPDMP